MDAIDQAASDALAAEADALTKKRGKAKAA